MGEDQNGKEWGKREMGGGGGESGNGISRSTLIHDVPHQSGHIVSYYCTIPSSRRDCNSRFNFFKDLLLSALRLAWGVWGKKS